jgi:hypothetical protein
MRLFRALLNETVIKPAPVGAAIKFIFDCRPGASLIFARKCAFEKLSRMYSSLSNLKSQISNSLICLL